MESERLYGNWRELNANLLWVYCGKPLRRGGRFRSRQLSAWWLMKGSLLVESEKSTLIPAGHWIFAAQQNHRREFSQDAEILSIKFELQWPNGRMLYHFDEAQYVPAEQHPMLGQAARALLRTVSQKQATKAGLLHGQTLSYGHYLKINQQFLAWLQAYLAVMDALRHTPDLIEREDTRILRARELLDAHPLQERVNLTALAGGIGLSFGHADALYHSTFGLTMRAYFDQRKLRAAVHWLTSTSMPVKAIAFALGFQHSAAFSHWFKRKEGCSPAQYRAARI